MLIIYNKISQSFESNTVIINLIMMHISEVMILILVCITQNYIKPLLRLKDWYQDGFHSFPWMNTR